MFRGWSCVGVIRPEWRPSWRPTPTLCPTFDAAAVEGSGPAASCPDGVRLIVTIGSNRAPYLVKGLTPECLRLVPGPETAAAFSVTRRYAACRRATTEFEKLKGVATTRPHDLWAWNATHVT